MNKAKPLQTSVYEIRHIPGAIRNLAQLDDSTNRSPILLVAMVTYVRSLPTWAGTKGIDSLGPLVCNNSGVLGTAGNLPHNLNHMPTRQILDITGNNWMRLPSG